MNRGQDLEIDLTPITGHAGVLIIDTTGDNQGVQKRADKTLMKYQGEMSVERKMARLQRLHFDVEFIKPTKPSVKRTVAKKGSED